MERYKRQIDLIGEDGQKKLTDACVVIVGAGGLGNICAKFLASSGVGCIEIWDYDGVETSNLNRQILFNDTSIGKNKARALADTIHKINPNIDCTAMQERFQAPYNLECVDVVIDCSDNLATSYFIEKLALRERIPMVFAKTSKYCGVVTVIKDKPYLKKNYPTKQLNKTNAVFPPIGGIIGSMQASFALKLLLGLETDDNILYYDALNNETRKFKKGD